MGSSRCDWADPLLFPDPQVTTPFYLTPAVGTAAPDAKEAVRPLARRDGEARAGHGR